jgi:hypothetical protein
MMTHAINLKRTVKMACDGAIERVKATLKAEGFGDLTRIGPREARQ